MKKGLENNVTLLLNRGFLITLKEKELVKGRMVLCTNSSSKGNLLP